MKRAAKFLSYARERYETQLRRERGESRPWTRDRIIQNYRFCCVFREDDRTTRWFRDHVRDPLSSGPDVLLATVVFRMFNRISTGEAIFCQTDLAGGGVRSVFGRGKYVTAFDLFLATGRVAHLRKAILAHCGNGPYVTGAYIISTPAGYTKLDGVLEILRRFYEGSDWRDAAAGMLQRRGSVSLEDAWRWFSQQDYLGKFHSYEIVTDLRRTVLLDRAPDIMTWASPGPGARRGLNRVLGKNYKDRSLSRDDLIQGMRELLCLSCDDAMWPAVWPDWEMREVEHTLCEFDKYERLRLGQGTVKGRFR